MNTKSKSSICGIGPKLLLSTFLYGLFTFFISNRYNSFFDIKFLSQPTCIILGIILLVIGIPYLIISIKVLFKEFYNGKLIKEGPFKVCRNPIYSAWNLFVIPGFVIFFKSWLMLTIPIFMYLLFLVLIKKEEECLAQQFVEEYLDYKNNVNLIFPDFFKLLQK